MIQNLANALDFYQRKGYELIEVPWMVPYEAIQVTLPKNKKSFSVAAAYDYHGELVGSAEQSFIYLMMEGRLKPGQRYVAMTPCFRDDKEDATHQRWFYKVELFTGYMPEHKIAINTLRDHIEFFTTDAEEYFNKCLDIEDYLEVRSVPGCSMDIEINGIEVGSYGYRTHEGYAWVYGTGCAEPRLTYALKQGHVPSNPEPNSVPK